MIQKTPQVDKFKQQMRKSLQHETGKIKAVRFARHANVYTSGDKDEMVYFIASGQVKLLLHSATGKECPLAIHVAGDVFGELCLSGLGPRRETATAMKQTMVKQIPCNQFLARLSRDSLTEGFLRYLTVRIADQHQVIANLVTGGQRAAAGPDVVAVGPHTGQEGPAQHPD
jgi:CRP/FNR family transcriptional regulator, cyclic AMP receptor protein